MAGAFILDPGERFTLGGQEYEVAVFCSNPSGKWVCIADGKSFGMDQGKGMRHARKKGFKNHRMTFFCDQHGPESMLTIPGHRGGW